VSIALQQHRDRRRSKDAAAVLGTVAYAAVERSVRCAATDRSAQAADATLTANASNCMFISIRTSKLVRVAFQEGLGDWCHGPSWMGAVMVLLTLVSTHARADNYFSTWKVLAECDARDGASQISCISYIAGVTDVLDDVYGYGGTSTVAYCRPELPMPYGQIRELFVRWSHAHPELLHIPARDAIHRALLEAFPCPRSNSAHKHRKTIAE
jgi:hypothetical protein